MWHRGTNLTKFVDTYEDTDPQSLALPSGIRIWHCLELRTVLVADRAQIPRGWGCGVGG